MAQPRGRGGSGGHLLTTASASASGSHAPAPSNQYVPATGPLGPAKDALAKGDYAEAEKFLKTVSGKDRSDALVAFRTRLPDLALIDIGLPDDVDGGFALCRELRALSATLPIIFLSARDSDFDVVVGLRLGADDYVTKDTSLPHLAARISALWNGRRVELTLTEFWMVHALARFPGHVKDRDSLMRDARIVVDDSTITSHVKRIRRKFQAVDPAFDCIDTVYGIGYRWNSGTE